MAYITSSIHLFESFRPLGTPNCRNPWGRPWYWVRVVLTPRESSLSKSRQLSSSRGSLLPTKKWVSGNCLRN